jgi:transposase InsO family protein
MNDCNRLQIKQAFTSYNNQKGNADTERVIRTIKEELVWLQQWTSPLVLKTELSAWIENYNRRYFQSSLGYLTPNQFENIYFEKTLLKSA